MFWRKKLKTGEQSKVEKLPGPTAIPDLVGRFLVVQGKRDPDWVWKLKAVVRKKVEGEKAFDVRVFDEAAVAAKKVKVKDYTSLDAHPDLILYEGWFDKKSLKAELRPGGQVKPEKS